MARKYVLFYNKQALVDLCKEVIKAEDFLSQLVKVVSNGLYSNNPEFNITRDIGSAMKQVPHFNYLRGLDEYLKSCIRKMCTGEMKLEDFDSEGMELLNQLLDADKCFSEEVLDAAGKTHSILF